MTGAARSSRLAQAWRTLFWFGATGGTAAVTHLAVFEAVIHLWPLLWPELANAIGFVVAFFVSFAGHRLLSFRGTRTPLLHSLVRFAATALIGFATNEVVFSLLVRVAGWVSWLALCTALVVAAGQTFVLGRFWAFQR